MSRALRAAAAALILAEAAGAAPGTPRTFWLRMPASPTPEHEAKVRETEAVLRALLGPQVRRDQFPAGAGAQGAALRFSGAEARLPEPQRAALLARLRELWDGDLVQEGLVPMVTLPPWQRRDTRWPGARLPHGIAETAAPAVSANLRAELLQGRHQFVYDGGRAFSAGPPLAGTVDTRLPGAYDARARRPVERGPDPRTTTVNIISPVRTRRTETKTEWVTHINRESFSGTILYSEPYGKGYRTLVLARADPLLRERGTTVFLPDGSDGRPRIAHGERLEVTGHPGLRDYSVNRVLVVDDSPLAIVEVITDRRFPASPLAPPDAPRSERRLLMAGFNKRAAFEPRELERAPGRPDALTLDADDARGSYSAVLDAENRIVGVVQGRQDKTLVFSNASRVRDFLKKVGLDYPKSGGRLRIPDYDGFGRSAPFQAADIDSPRDTGSASQAASSRAEAQARRRQPRQRAPPDPAQAPQQRQPKKPRRGGGGCAPPAEAADGTQGPGDAGGPGFWLFVVGLARLLRRRGRQVVVAPGLENRNRVQPT